jgi:hypothetical protein
MEVKMQPKTLDNIIENVVKEYLKIVDQDAVVLPKVLDGVITRCLEGVNTDGIDDLSSEIPLLNTLIEEIKESVNNLYELVPEKNKTPETEAHHRVILNSLDNLNVIISASKVE